MHKVVSVTSQPLIAELSLTLYVLGSEYYGQVLSNDARRTGNVSVYPWSCGFDFLLKGASVAFFPACGPEIVPFVNQARRAGVPVVMFAKCLELPIKHDETGMVYINSTWGRGWIRELATDQTLRKRIIENAMKFS